ncbi:MAG: HD domain-containing protein [Treponema sp.]|nr:HD domain-containing protein [Treponema sp.]
MIMPGIFMGLVALISVILIYQSNEQIIKTQKKYRKELEEFDTIKSHAKRGYEILKDVKIQDDIAAGAHYHHERYDGKGYPDGLSDTQIPQIARIISVADAFDAMSSTRSYRKKLPLDFIAEEIKRCSGTQFDPDVAEAFLQLYREGAFDNLRQENW